MFVIEYSQAGVLVQTDRRVRLVVLLMETSARKVSYFGYHEMSEDDDTVLSLYSLRIRFAYVLYTFMLCFVCIQRTVTMLRVCVLWWCGLV